MKPAILLLSGGSLVGQNVIQALRSRRHQLRLLATNSIATEPSLQDFDEVKLVAPTLGNEKQLSALLIEWMKASDIKLVIPCRDDDVVFLSKFAHQYPHVTSRLLCGSHQMAESMLDKWKSWQFANLYDLPFAPTALATDRQAVQNILEQYGFPLIVKPRVGFASRGVKFVMTMEQLENVIGNELVLVQKYLGDKQPLYDYMRETQDDGLPLFHSFESVKHSIQAMIATDSSVIDIFATIHTMRRGISVGITKDLSEDALILGDLCAKAFAKHGWQGPVNIQCHRNTKGELEIYEFNGRFTGATAGRLLLGFDEVGVAISHFTHCDLEELIKVETSSITRQLTSRYTSLTVQRSLETRGSWQRTGLLHK